MLALKLPGMQKHAFEIAGASNLSQSFVDLKENAQLKSPADGARRVLAYLARPDFGSNPIGDVRD